MSQSRHRILTKGEPADTLWAETINGCYEPPIFTYNLPDHLYLPDSEAIISVKEAAATVAYDKVVAQIEKEAERRR